MAVATVVTCLAILVVSTILLALLAGSTQRTKLGPLILMGVYYTIFYGLGSLYLVLSTPKDSRFAVGNGFIAQAAFLGTLTWVCIAAGAAAVLYGQGSKARLSRSQAEPNEQGRNPERSQQVYGRLELAGLAAIGWAARVIQFASGEYFHVVDEVASSGSRWTLVTLAELPLLVFVAYLVRYLQGQWRSRSVLLCLFLIEIAWGLPSGQREDVALPVIMALLTVSYIVGLNRSMAKPAMAVVMLMLPLLSILSDYRGNQASDSQADPVGSLIAATQAFAEDPTSGYSRSVQLAAQRLSDPLPVALALERGLATTWGETKGETLSWVPLAAFPRAVFPSRRDPGIFGNPFGKSVGLVHPRDRRTTVTSGHPIEFLANAGWGGVTILGFSLGAALMSLETWILKRSATRAMWIPLLVFVTWPIARSPSTLLAAGAVGSVRKLVLFVLMWAAVRTAVRLLSGRLGQSSLSARQGPGVSSLASTASGDRA